QSRTRFEGGFAGCVPRFPNPRMETQRLGKDRGRRPVPQNLRVRDASEEVTARPAALPPIQSQYTESEESGAAWCAFTGVLSDLQEKPRSLRAAGTVSAATGAVCAGSGWASGAGRSLHRYRSRIRAGKGS